MFLQLWLQLDLVLLFGGCLLIEHFDEGLRPHDHVECLDEAIDRVGNSLILHANGFVTQVQDAIQLVTLYYDFGSVPHKPHVHSEEIFAELGVLLNYIKLRQVPKSDIARLLIDVLQCLVELRVLTKHSHHYLDRVDIRSNRILVVAIEDTHKYLVDKRQKLQLQRSHAYLDELA